MPVARRMETRNSILQTVIAILSRHQAEDSFEISHRRTNLTPVSKVANNLST